MSLSRWGSSIGSGAGGGGTGGGVGGAGVTPCHLPSQRAGAAGSLAPSRQLTLPAHHPPTPPTRKQLASEAGHLTMINKHKTLTAREVQVSWLDAAEGRDAVQLLRQHQPPLRRALTAPMICRRRRCAWRCLGSWAGTPSTRARRRCYTSRGAAEAAACCRGGGSAIGNTVQLGSSRLHSIREPLSVSCIMYRSYVVPAVAVAKLVANERVHARRGAGALAVRRRRRRAPSVCKRHC